jgi:cardiolipin synthase (CMP-forming)
VINLPNLITLARLAAAPLAVYLVLNEAWPAAFWVFVAAGLSDALDGYLANRLGARTLIGGYLDPLADKVLLLGVFVTLGLMHHLPEWLVILVGFREIVIVGGALLVHTATGRLVMQPLMISKINTALQFALAALVLGRLGFGFERGVLTLMATWLVAFTTCASGAAYVVTWGRRLADLESRP